MRALSAQERQRAKDARRRGAASFRTDDGETIQLADLPPGVFTAGDGGYPPTTTSRENR